jgi:SseB protein N-terminal domain
MAPARATLPSDVLLLPILPPTLGEDGRPVGEVQVLLARTTDGTMVAEAYTSPERLVTARGKLQAWIAVRRPQLADILDSQDVGRLLVDAGSPEGYAIDSDGTRTPLPAPATDPTVNDSTQEVPENGAGA